MYRKILNFILDNIFLHLEKLGVHVLPVQYYFPIPEVRKLQEDIWKKVSELPGIEMNEDFQIKLLELFLEYYGKEFNSLRYTSILKLKLSRNPCLLPPSARVHERDLNLQQSSYAIVATFSETSQ